jgi:hypothetical protein
MTSGRGSQLQSKWSHHPLGLMCLISSERKTHSEIEQILHTKRKPALEPELQ